MRSVLLPQSTDKVSSMPCHKESLVNTLSELKASIPFEELAVRRLTAFPVLPSRQQGPGASQRADYMLSLLEATN